VNVWVIFVGLKTKELNLVQNLLVTLHSQNKWAAVASTKTTEGASFINIRIFSDRTG